MKKKLLEIQEKVIKEIWKEWQGFITVEDISQIFRVNKQKVYRIFKKEKGRNKEE